MCRLQVSLKIADIGTAETADLEREIYIFRP